MGIYNWFTINTPSYGPVPFVAFPGGFNAGTRVLSMMVAPHWFDSFISDRSTFNFTQMQAELQAATTLYAACVWPPWMLWMPARRISEM